MSKHPLLTGRTHRVLFVVIGKRESIFFKKFSFQLLKTETMQKFGDHKKRFDFLRPDLMMLTLIEHCLQRNDILRYDVLCRDRCGESSRNYTYHIVIYAWFFDNIYLTSKNDLDK